MVVADGWSDQNYVFFSHTFYRSGYTVAGNKNFDQNFFKLHIK